MPKSLTPRLAALRDEIHGYAKEFGLDFFDTVFEMVSYDEMNMVAAYGGFPTRYPHWRWGMEYEQLAKGYEYGLSKIYELVINNDPCYAYLMESNPEVDQKLVMAHVYGHCDFFKNNFSFRHTNRRMIDEMANHATRVRRWVDKIGVEKVEDFIDRTLSLENLIDQHSPHIRRNPDPKRVADELKANEGVEGFKVGREYMRGYINPSEFLDSQRKKVEDEKQRAKKFPERPQRDVLLFLLEEAPLEPWESDILAILREEAHYFAPQGQTKIMNEGWASYWHSTIMTRRALRDDEIIDYADHHSGTMGTRPGAINPYKLGIELWRDIEERWNKGRFGKEWDECDDLRARRSWDKKSGAGREKIFEVRKHYNDITFIDTFLTPEFAMEQKLFVYGFNDKRNSWEILDREFRKVKSKLLQGLTNFGQPIIEVVDANHENRGELLLAHKHDGQDLKGDYARETLKNLQSLWRRPVNIITRYDNKGVMLRFDGTTQTEKKVEL
ncbi:SpoVR family protein [Myxococcus qinghaiensis]|uniref:SpoVR family protein n=1 Tax=Myxococcus qinghaiensis TaxID=2906758 RepID=UPI0020A71771|nr:SpoVR family protein [Myxococcus qinghaiensis]MCP3164493.1 SpoVR family protein [Myxococcus qinghaiensis]